MSMKDRTIASLQANAGLRRHGLHVGQAVEVRRGTLAGMSGVLIGFKRDHNCMIELDVAQRGVVLIIAAAAVKVLSESASHEDKRARAAEV